MAPDGLSKNKGKVKNLIDQYNNQEKHAVVDLKPQHKEASSSPDENNTPKDSSNVEQQVAPKGNKIKLGLKIVNGVAAFVAFSLAIGSVVVQSVQGELMGIVSIIKSAATLMSRAANVEMPATSFRDKFIKKLESTKGGKVLSNTVGTIWKALTCKPAKRFYKIGMAVLTIVTAPTPVGIVFATISLTAISYNVIKESVELRDANRLMQEHGLLKQHVKHKQKQNELISALESSQLPDLKNFAKVYKTSLGQKRDTQEVRAAVKTSKVAEVLRAVRDNFLEAFAAIGKSATGDPIDQAMAAFVTLGNVTGEANKNLQNRKEKFALQKANDALQMEITPYKSLEELKTFDREERIKTEALSRFVTEVQNSGVSKSPEERFAILCKEVEQESAFALPPKEAFFTRTTSTITAGVGYIMKSQFGNVSNLYVPKQTEENTPSQQKQAALKNDITKSAKREVELAQHIPDVDKPVAHKDDPKSIAKSQIKPSVIPSASLPYSKELKSKIRSR